MMQDQLRQAPNLLTKMRKQRDAFRNVALETKHALQSLAKGEHDTDCKFSYCPIGECPTCAVRREATVRKLIYNIQQVEKANQ